MALTVGYAATATVTRGEAARPPNILLIVADDLGYGDLGSYGHPTLKTPSLDRLAREGLRFTSYYAASPLCSPSRAGMLTGRTPFRTGIESWIPEGSDVQLGPREVTLATLLKRRGYQTFLSGKWHLNGGLDVPRHAQPADHGFEHSLAFHAFAIPYEGGIRVPAIVRWPGHVAPGRETDTPVIGYDLLPTLAGIAGAAVPGDRRIDGEDLAPLLRGQAFTRQRPLYWEFEDDQGFHYALRDGNSKLIADRSLAKRRLFDLAGDRFEVDDRAARDPNVVDALLAKLRVIAADVARDALRPVRPPRP